jgi:hypothetical protein
MLEDHSVQELLALRRVTRAISDFLRRQLKEYLATLSPLFRPRNVLGDYVQGGPKEMAKGADAAFKELQVLYDTVAQTKLFSLPPSLKAPIETVSSALEITPVQYVYEANTERESKTVTITSPFSWVLSYAGFAPRPLDTFRFEREEGPGDLHRFVLHHLVLNVVMSRQQGVAKILEALHFPSKSEPSAEFGGLPITQISACISTIRPPDSIIIESTEVSGTDAFEEVVNIEEIGQIRDPLKEQLLELVKGKTGFTEG